MLIPVWPKNVRRRTIRLVGMTYMTGKVGRLDGRARSIELRFMVDSGAVFTVLPEDAWKRSRMRNTTPGA